MIAFTPRLGWNQIPDGVRTAIGDAVVRARGATVRGATPVTGGFSPGCAVVLDLDDGSQVFVKTTSGDLNPDSPLLYARERVVAQHLPGAVPAPRLLAGVEHEGWVGLIFEFVPGRLAHFPWTAGDWAATTRALDTLAAATAPAGRLGIPDLRPVAHVVADSFAGWANLRRDPAGELPDDLAGAVTQGLDAGLDRLVETGLQALRDAPTSAQVVLGHLDVRPDNVLIRPDGSAVIVDWPWACAAPAWFDTLTALISVQHGTFHTTRATTRATTRPADAATGRRAVPPDAAGQLAVLPLTRDVDPEAITGVLAGWAGFFLDSARRPPAPGLPTLREFQRSQGISTLAWVLDRLGREGSALGDSLR